MGSASFFSIQPTFTQGLVIGQLSILVLFAFVFKYLFLTQDPLAQSTSYRPRSAREIPSADSEKRSHAALSESTEWLNTTLLHIVSAYRSKLRDDLSGSKGENLMRQRVQDFINAVRPQSMLSPITIHAIDLGSSAPCLSNARPYSSPSGQDSVQFDLSYTDNISVSISTAYLFNYPVFAFAQLPVSLTISLSLFACSVVISPPSPASPAPAMSMSILPDFTLELETSSLLGSRAKLADVPKLHELITEQIRRQLAQRGSLKIPLPGLASVAEVKQEVKREMLSEKFDR